MILLIVSFDFKIYKSHYFAHYSLIKEINLKSIQIFMQNILPW